MPLTLCVPLTMLVDPSTQLVASSQFLHSNDSPPVGYVRADGSARQPPTLPPARAVIASRLSTRLSTCPRLCHDSSRLPPTGHVQLNATDKPTNLPSTTRMCIASPTIETTVQPNGLRGDVCAASSDKHRCTSFAALPPDKSDMPFLDPTSFKFRVVFAQPQAYDAYFQPRPSLFAGDGGPEGSERIA
ncbi:hypothetical protein FB45DRAFT_920392 [Roridomyces roridus]|uniref:Uncharacterized protein n=1 Tax=Roridomyces roridus TaxID=1738132 RepID=A0AAD7FIY3_9AGAR|nr:hypothetical protein FB45DRAFT_920392 [Roridomyces roridus]